MTDLQAPEADDPIEELAALDDAACEEEEEPVLDEAEAEMQELMSERERQGFAYGAVDDSLAEDGKWFRWEKLGPEAELKIAQTGNDRATELWDKAVRKWGKRRGQIPYKKRQSIAPQIYAQSIFVGMRGVRLPDPKTGEPTDTIEVKQKVGGQWKLVPVKFTVDGDGYLLDTAQNRAKLWKYLRGLDEDILDVANEELNFETEDPEAVLGN